MNLLVVSVFYLQEKIKCCNEGGCYAQNLTVYCLILAAIRGNHKSCCKWLALSNWLLEC